MIAVGSDHGGFHLKTLVVDYLESNGYRYIDFGTSSPESVDYPDYAQKVAHAVITGQCDKGIVICGTGIGVSITVNKFPGIRAALCTNEYMARMSRQHNDSNILALGERVLGAGLALDILKTWLQTEFTGGRHSDRLQKIEKIEQNYFNRSEDHNG